MARFLAQKGLARGFFWSAAQAIEKYLKAFLLLRGISVKKYKNHPVEDIFRDVTNIDSSICNIDLSRHPKTITNGSIGEVLTSTFIASGFVADILKHGHSDNRYNAFGIEFDTGHLFALDTLFFHIRD